MIQYKKLLKNSFLFGIGSIGSRAITFLLLPVFTRFLSTEEYGEIDVIVTTILLLVPILSLQAQEISFRYSMDKKRDQRITLMNSLFLCLGGFLVLLAVRLLINSESFFQHLNIFSLVMFFAMIDAALKQFIRCIGKIKIFVASDILYSLTFSICIVIFVVLYNWSVEGYLLSLLFAYLSSVFLILFIGKANAYLQIHYLNFPAMKGMLKYSIPLIPTAIMWWAINVSDRYLISYFIDYQANGIYAIASKIPVVLVTFNSVFFKAWQITAIEELRKENFLETFRRVFQTLSVNLLLLSSLIIICIKPLFSLLADGDFYSGWKYAPVLLVSVIFSAFSQFWGVIYVATKKTYGALWTAAFGAVTNFILNLILIPLYGLYGAAIATLVAFLAMWLSRYFHIRSLDGIFTGLNHFFGTLVIVIVQILVLHYLKNSNAYIVNFTLFGFIIIVNWKSVKSNVDYLKEIISRRLSSNT